MPKPYIPNDAWSRKAADEGYRARSVYKLQELDERYKLFKSGLTVLDLGAAPGSWLQYAAEKIGPKGKLVGIDIKPIEPVEHAKTFEQDITDVAAVLEILKSEDIETVDLVMSDLAPNTSGTHDIDQWRSIELSQAVLAVASACLKANGTCVMKILRGADFDEFITQAKRDWKSVQITSVQASRDRSSEAYVLVSGRL